MLGSERPVVLAGQRDVESVVEGSSFSLECHVSVPVNIDTRVTIMWKHEDLVLQADNVKVRHDPNMNITLVKKTSMDMTKTSYSTYLAVAVAEKKYQGRKLHLVSGVFYILLHSKKVGGGKIRTSLGRYSFRTVSTIFCQFQRGLREFFPLRCASHRKI